MNYIILICIFIFILILINKKKFTNFLKYNYFLYEKKYRMLNLGYYNNTYYIAQILKKIFTVNIINIEKTNLEVVNLICEILDRILPKKNKLSYKKQNDCEDRQILRPRIVYGCRVPYAQPR